MRQFYFLSITLLLFTISACSNDTPTLKPLAKDAVILAFGDSLTYGTGANSPENSYPAQLSKLIDRTVVSSGIPGEVSQTGRARLSHDLKKHQPALVILCHGGNDFLQRKDTDVLKSNLIAMIEDARSSGAEVLLIAVPKFGLFLKPAPLYQDVSEQLNVPLNATSLSDILVDQNLKADTVHPNNAGYAKLAKEIATTLRTAGAIN